MTSRIPPPAPVNHCTHLPSPRLRHHQGEICMELFVAVWRRPGDTGRGSIHIPIWGWILSPSCYHLYFLNIRAVTESKIAPRSLYFAYLRQNILFCKCGQWTLDRHKSCKRKEILTHNSSFFQLNEVCHSVERVQQHGMKTYCLQIFSKSISFGCSRKKRFSPSGFWNKHMFNFYIFHNVPVPPQKIIFINFYGLNVRGILWPWRRM